MKLKRRRVTVRVTEIENPRNVTTYYFTNYNGIPALDRAKEFITSTNMLWRDSLKVEKIGKYA